ncbi:cyclic nucleotide-binding domain-containing protein [Parapedobacter koreensis]|uniref:Uncharacterized protein n=1 Tax=Parapedobacter koreensis TaxID=332977 RepID=A0A1H7FD42_9SPHI|nr:hypothetical protein [Parapedobacter koreensis]SEK24011.1 hypothetical protein SAMN05421740_101312 [Parapedobacter koreensis]
MKTLGELLSDIGCDAAVYEQLLPLFRLQRMPRGMDLSLRRGSWDNLGIISSGYLSGYFHHSFEDHTLCVLGPGKTLPPLNFSGGFPPDIFLESVTRVELYVLDINAVISLGPEMLSASLSLLMKSYDCIIEELIFWASVSHLPRGESRFGGVVGHDELLVGGVPNDVLASATRLSLRHFMRIKNGEKKVFREKA